jgi:hypothetical protein
VSLEGRIGRRDDGRLVQRLVPSGGDQALDA